MRAARSNKKAPNIALETGKAAFLALILSFVLVVLYAVALKEELVPGDTITAFTTGIKVICAAAAGVLAARKCRSRLWMYGGIAGAVYTLLALGVFSAVAGSVNIGVAMLSDIGMGILSGVLSVMLVQALK